MPLGHGTYCTANWKSAPTTALVLSYPLSSSFPPAAWHRLVGNKEKGFVTSFFTHIQGKSLQVKGVANPFSIDASPPSFPGSAQPSQRPQR